MPSFLEVLSICPNCSIRLHLSLTQARMAVSGELKPGRFTLSGDGLCVGCDSGDAASQEYKTPGTFKGGKIFFVGITVEKAQCTDLAKEAQRLLMVQ